jgi:putative peptide zinc metalloprotease protein
VAADITVETPVDPTDPTEPTALAEPGEPGEPGEREPTELADGVELLGPYEGSGLREAPYLIRRRDGQVVQVSRLLYLVAESLAPGRPLDEVAALVAGTSGRDVTAANVAFLVEQRLRPAGLLRSDGEGGPLARANPLLGLRLRLPLVPERAHRRVTRACLPLFRRPVVAAVLAGLVAVDAWLATGARGDLVAGVREVVYRPQLMLLFTVLTLVSGVFHETGHATAARYGGARPGAMGAGIYLVWPVFYTDVTDSYRLSRAGRLRTDLGGVYFNVVAVLVVTATYLGTGFRPLLVFLLLVQAETLAQFLPFVRLDGYYVVSDLAGVPNLFAYMKPTLARLVRRRGTPAHDQARAKLDELTRRSRLLITLWVGLTLPFLLVNGVLLLVILPRLAGAAVGSAGAQLDAVVAGSGLDLGGRLNGLVGLVLLVLPLAGALYVLSRLANRLRTVVGAWWLRRPALTATATATVGLMLVLQVGIFWPDTFLAAFHHAQKAHQLAELADSPDYDYGAGSAPVTGAGAGAGSGSGAGGTAGADAADGPADGAVANGAAAGSTVRDQLAAAGSTPSSTSGGAGLGPAGSSRSDELAAGADVGSQGADDATGADGTGSAPTIGGRRWPAPSSRDADDDRPMPTGAPSSWPGSPPPTGSGAPATSGSSGSSGPPATAPPTTNRPPVTAPPPTQAPTTPPATTTTAPPNPPPNLLLGLIHAIFPGW